VKAEIQPHSFLTSAPDGGTLLTSCCGYFILGKEPWYPLRRWVGGRASELVWTFFFGKKKIYFCSCHNSNPILWLCSSIMLVCFYKNTQHDIPKDSHCCESPESHRLDRILLSTDIWNNVPSQLLGRKVGRTHGGVIPNGHCYQHSCLSAVSDFSVRWVMSL